MFHSVSLLSQAPLARGSCALLSILFSTKSVSESGTLYQIRNLLHRTAVPIDPGKNMKAAKDYLLLVLHAHVVATAERLLHSESFAGSSPSPLDVARAIVDTHLLLPTSQCRFLILLFKLLNLSLFSLSLSPLCSLSQSSLYSLSTIPSFSSDQFIVL